jgi:hypothetical protein
MCSPEHGTCVRDDSKGSTLNKCVCHEGTNWNESRPVGLNCELVAECHFFVPDARTIASLPATPGASVLMDTEFRDLGVQLPYFDQVELEKAMMMHHRPIYVNAINEDSMYLKAFMIFTGRRWGIFMAPHYSDPANKTIEIEGFKRFLLENDSANKPVQTMRNIRLVYPTFEPLFFTLPVNYGEESYHKQDGIPWVGTEEAAASVIFSRKADDDQQLPVRFLCSDCVSDGLCGTSQP